MEKWDRESENDAWQGKQRSEWGDYKCAQPLETEKDYSTELPEGEDPCQNPDAQTPSSFSPGPEWLAEWQRAQTLQAHTPSRSEALKMDTASSCILGFPLALGFQDFTPVLSSLLPAFQTSSSSITHRREFPDHCSSSRTACGQWSNLYNWALMIYVYISITLSVCMCTSIFIDRHP